VEVLMHEDASPPPSGRPSPRAAVGVGVAVLALVGACGTAGGGGRPGSANPPSGAIAGGAASPSVAAADLSAVLRRAIIEERHARATYQNVLDTLGPVTPFRSVVASEGTHVTALETVARTHGITLTADTEQGTPSPPTIAAACAMGVAAEQADARLYDELLPSVADHPDVQRVFTNLRAASLDNHLPAFQRCT
jgi:hypothetical protein